MEFIGLAAKYELAWGHCNSEKGEIKTCRVEGRGRCDVGLYISSRSAPLHALKKSSDWDPLGFP